MLGELGVIVVCSRRSGVRQCVTPADQLEGVRHSLESQAVRMDRDMPTRKILVPALLLSIVAGCEVWPLGETPFQEPTCPPPCWRGITPGKTSRSEALSLVSAMGDVHSPPVELEPASPLQFEDELGFTLFKSDGPHLLIYSSGDTVQLIGFQLPLLIYPAGQAIRDLGSPQSILVLAAGEFEVVTLLNAETGIAMGYSYNGPIPLQRTQISVWTSITDVVLFNPDVLDKVIDFGDAFLLHPHKQGDGVRVTTMGRLRKHRRQVLAACKTQRQLAHLRMPNISLDRTGDAGRVGGDCCMLKTVRGKAVRDPGRSARGR